MNAHILNANGVIINTIIVDSLSVLPNLVDASLGGVIGDTVTIGGVIVKKSVVPAKNVPEKVSRRQALQALFLANITGEMVEAAIASHLTSPQKELALIEWKESLEFERRRALVVSMGPLLNLTVDEIDNLFIAAAGL